ncbi:nicotinate-nucleotide--dimethylbenzimidazole phosphoribosyltransferase [Streptomyces sp. NPDC093225]|uniref:nicotinate-nucleotide--dimethylbenzimidazole phosphoribosyltransferase n=1 Tax=Streptomyces sp. NPDC093225 TaxID=3366034 RepID=UPI00381CEACC
MTDTGQVPGEGLPENAGMVDQQGGIPAAEPGLPVPGAYTYLDPADNGADEDEVLLMPSGTGQGVWSDPQIVPQAPPAPFGEDAFETGSFQTGSYEPVAFDTAGFDPAAAQAPGVAGFPAPGAYEMGSHEAGGRDSGAVDLGGVRMTPAAGVPTTPPRRPLHMGPPVPDATGGVVRSLADRGPAAPAEPVPAAPLAAPAAPVAATAPAAMPVRQPGPPTTGPEYFDVPRTEHLDAGVLPGPQLGEIPPQAGAPWGTEPPQGAEPVVPAAVAEPVAGPAPEAVAAAGGAATPGTPGAPVPPVAADPGLPGATAGQPVAVPGGPAEAVVPAAVPTPGPEATPAEGVTVPAEVLAVPAPEQAVAAVPAAPAEPVAVVAEPVAEAVAPAPGPVLADVLVSGGAAVVAQPVPAAAEAPVAEPVVAESVVAESVIADPAAAEAAVAAATGPAEPVVPEAAVPAQADAEPAVAPPAEPAPAESQAVAEAAVEAPADGAAQPLAAEAPLAPAPGPVVVEPAAEPVAAEPVVAQPMVAEPVVEPVAEPVAVPVQPVAPEAVAAEPQPAPVPQQPEALADGATPAEGPEAVPAEAVTVVPETPEAAPQQPAAAPEAVAATDAPQPPAADQAAPVEPTEPTAPVDAAADEAPGTDEERPAPAPGYAEAEREAVLRVMRERRDIRNGFRTDPIPHEVLLRVLEAAHTAPSVGHSQPWDFVVIRSADTRRTMHELATRQREAYAKSLPKGRAKQFKELKIEAILDTPVNIVVTADPTRGGRHTLGRHTQPQMAPYSSALAVENLWLAARAEGLGVGWVSFFDEREMVRALGLPEHLEVVAYLCVGYVDEFPDEPELMQAGWSKRRPLSWVVHEETYGRRALPGEEPHDLLSETVSNIRPLDAKALGEAWERQKRMTKPAGALGMLEIISAQLSGLSRMCPPPIPEPAAVAIFAGDHGVHAQGVTPWPQEVTSQMVANFLGGGAVCNAFANQVGAEVCVVDVGVAGELPATPGLLPRKVRAGTADMTTGPAMTREEAIAAIEVGIETARDLVAAGNKGLLTGEMGIANTTASAALISVFTDTDPSEVTGRGTGINDETLARKTEVVRRAIEFHQPDPADPIGVLAAIGGLEHAAMVGLVLGGASLRTPVILDGVSAGAAALVARAIAPESLAACIAGHRSAEPGHVAALNKLGLRPLVDLDLRLGEGTGALLALPLVQSAARAMHEVATFDSAGVTEK